MIKYSETPEFQKDFKKLAKKFQSLPADFAMAKRAAIELYHIHHLNNQSVFEIQGLNGMEKIYKLKKFACKTLKGRGNRSGIRIIYAFNQTLNKITFIEIYYKGNTENEDRKRIKNYLKGLDTM